MHLKNVVAPPNQVLCHRSLPPRMSRRVTQKISALILLFTSPDHFLITHIRYINCPQFCLALVIAKQYVQNCLPGCAFVGATLNRLSTPTSYRTLTGHTSEHTMLRLPRSSNARMVTFISANQLAYLASYPRSYPTPPRASNLC